MSDLGVLRNGWCLIGPAVIQPVLGSGWSDGTRGLAGAGVRKGFGLKHPEAMAPVLRQALARLHVFVRLGWEGYARGCVSGIGVIPDALRCAWRWLWVGWIPRRFFEAWSLSWVENRGGVLLLGPVEICSEGKSQSIGSRWGGELILWYGFFC